MKAIHFLILTVGIFITTILLAYDYPMKPFNKQHKIIATFAESRGTRFHNGVDIKPKTTVSTDTFWLVYSLVSDTMLRITYSGGDTINNGVRDKSDKYSHIFIFITV